MSALSALGFRQAETVTSRQQPEVFHFLGSDAGTGRLVNVHAYARVLTGDHFLKSWTWPLEELLLDDTRSVDGVRIPAASAELAGFTLRGLVKRTGSVTKTWPLAGSQVTPVGSYEKDVVFAVATSTRERVTRNRFAPSWIPPASERIWKG